MPTTFDFDHLPSRLGTRSYKWDEAEPDVLPLWVADMDFPTAPCVQQAVMRRAQHPCFGYTLVPEAYYRAVVRWFWDVHQWHIHAHEVLYTIGVIPAIAAILKAQCQVGDNVVVLSPVYNCFFNLIRNAGCQALEVGLKEAEAGGRLTYSIDWEALEHALSHPKTTVLLLCNPHNPVGRIWQRDELLHLAQLCQRHGIFVVSDEIHNELTAPGLSYVPWGTLGEDYQDQAAICTSASKAFNTAGLQNASIVIRNAEVRRRVDRAINLNETCDVNPFGIEATIAAYDEGREWLEALRAYVWDNYDFARAYLNNALPQLRIAELQATYLMWVDYSACCPLPSTQLSQRLKSEAKVWLAAGSDYGTFGEHHLRINLATSRQTLTEALNRFVTWLKTHC